MNDEEEQAYDLRVTFVEYQTIRYFEDCYSVPFHAVAIAAAKCLAPELHERLMPSSKLSVSIVMPTWLLYSGEVPRWAPQDVTRVTQNTVARQQYVLQTLDAHLHRSKADICLLAILRKEGP